MNNNFNCKTKNLIYVVICQGCKDEYFGETSCLVKERINVYRQHVSQPKYPEIQEKEHFRLCSDREFQGLPFLQMNQENKLLRKTCENYFIDYFKPLYTKIRELCTQSQL